jgi:NADH pyrophosphatase NudC (nudix superfamily)
MAPTRNVCDNVNHTRREAPVRYCPQCGGVVNAQEEGSACEEAKHAAARRRHTRYCSACGAELVVTR